MSKYEYKYENLLDKGYKQFTLTKKQHNNLFEKRKINWDDRYEYYYNDKYIILHRFTNWKCIALNTTLFPFLVLIHGLGNFKEILNDFKKLFNQKKYGAFTGDTVYKGAVCKGMDLYEEIMKIIN